MINTIVLAEDNLEHCFFFKNALKSLAPQIQFSEVHDGDKLVELLQKYLPDLLFLDLNMPCKNGVQCIKEIRENKAYDYMPIIVFTISSHPNAIQTAYGLGANLYIIKPQEYSSLVMILRKILSWDWNEPKKITEKHFQNNKYLPFSYAE